MNSFTNDSFDLFLYDGTVDNQELFLEVKRNSLLLYFVNLLKSFANEMNESFANDRIVDDQKLFLEEIGSSFFGVSC